MKRSAASLGAPDVLQKLGRPGFPQGMIVLLVGNLESERKEIEEQLQKLCYLVTSCETCCQARQLLVKTGAETYDIILAEASLLAKDNLPGQLLLEAASGTPLVLISSPATTTEYVWRSIEVGAADVLEKPLSLLKLQNIWQHVVRKAMDEQEHTGGRSRAFSKDEELPQQTDACVRSGRGTPSSSMSAATVTHLPPGTMILDQDGSDCGSQDVKEGSLCASMCNSSPENSHTVDGPASGSDLQMGKVGRSYKRARDTAAVTAGGQGGPGSRPVIRQSSWPSQPHFSTRFHHSSAAPTALGVVHPSWANCASQSMRGSIPSGCVWGTPLNPPPGWPGTISNGAGPLLGSAAISRCHSAPVSKLDTFAGNQEKFAPIPELDGELMADLTNDLLLGDDFLGCGDNFLDNLAVPSETAAEKPPIGLRLRKSESLVDLINQQLSNCRAVSA